MQSGIAFHSWLSQFSLSLSHTHTHIREREREREREKMKRKTGMQRGMKMEEKNSFSPPNCLHPKPSERGNLRREKNRRDG